MKIIIAISLLLITLTSQKGNPSVTVWWKTEKVFAAAVEITIKDVFENTNYRSLAFDDGYFGLQEKLNKEKMILFSLWDDKSGKAKNIEVGEEIKVDSISGKDKGIKAFSQSLKEGSEKDLASWKSGNKYIYLVKATSVTGGTKYEGYLYKPEIENWSFIASHFKPQPDNDALKGKLNVLLSYLEDFLGNKGLRSAIFSAWVKVTPLDNWISVVEVKGESRNIAEKKRRVSIIKDAQGYDVVELSLGGEEMADSSLFKGTLKNPPPVPDAIKKFNQLHR